MCVWGGRDPAAAAGVGEAAQAQRNRDRPGPVTQGKEGGDTDRDPLGGAAIGTRESHGGGGGGAMSSQHARLGDPGTLGVCELGGSQHGYPHS